MNKFFFIVFIVLSSLVAAQGPVDGFFKGKGNLDVALSGANQHAEKFYDGLGLINYKRNLTCVGLFAEYGIGNNWDAIVSVPFINGKFQDASLFVKNRICWPMSYGIFSLIPAAGFSFPMSNYQTETSQAIGQQAIQIQPKLLVQFDATGSVPFFVQFQSGYNYAFDPVPSSFSFSSKIGWMHKKMYADLWFDYQKGIGGKAWHVDPISSFRELFVSYTKIGGVFYYAFRPKWGLFVNGSYILSGINIGKAYSLGAGFVYKFDFLK